MPLTSTTVSRLRSPDPAAHSGGGEDNRASPDLRAQPLHEKIAAAAEQLWHGYGRPEGRDVEIWLEAERQVLGVDPEVARVGGASDADALNQASPPSTAAPGGARESGPGKAPGAGTAISPSPASS
jgi:hypothetical protein